MALREDERMSDRHMHITGFLYEEERVIEQFADAARSLGFFDAVVPVRLHDAGPVRAVAFHSRDLDGISDELEMPEVARKLSGILKFDTVIVSAWEYPLSHRDREHVWTVRGTGDKSSSPGSGSAT
jgi:hypothetical protein